MRQTNADEHASPPAAPRPADLPEGGEIAIRARGLTRRFSDFTAVDSVSFDISRGEIFGFLGSNGCGKTTTMKMLTGLLPATEGEAWIFGQPVADQGMEARARVGFMSQSFSLYGELTVQENLVLHARLYHLGPALSAARLADLVPRFGLTEHMGQKAGELRLGLRQRWPVAWAAPWRACRCRRWAWPSSATRGRC